jgi:hypothetical protein
MRCNETTIYYAAGSMSVAAWQSRARAQSTPSYFLQSSSFSEKTMFQTENSMQVNDA